MKTPLNLIWFAALLPVSSPAYAATPQPLENDNRTLTVLAHDYAGLQDGSVYELQSLSAILLSRVGIRVDWVWCNAGRRDERSALCGAQPTRGHIVIRILTGYPGHRLRPVPPLASAAVEDGHASLYALEIRQFASDNGLSLGCLLGYAAVHEIGHVLMGKGHSRSGIMRAVWDRSDFAGMAQSGLTFSKPEGEKLRRAVPATATYRAAVTQSTPRPASFPQNTEGK
jgi:hypothetical protein